MTKNVIQYKNKQLLISTAKSKMSSKIQIIIKKINYLKHSIVKNRKVKCKETKKTLYSKTSKVKTDASGK